MAQAYYFTSTAVQTQLNATITNSATSVQVASTVGWPGSYPYVVAFDYGASNEELVTVTANNAGLLTITRGFDNTSAQAHSAGAVVRHVYCGNDANTAYTHFAATSGVHGILGNVVGDSDTQTLTNKTLTNPTVTTGTFTSPSVTGMTLSGTVTNSSTFKPATAAGSTFIGQVLASQTGLALSIIDNSSNPLFSVGPTGGYISSTQNTSVIPAVTNAITGVTVNLAEWRVNNVAQATLGNTGLMSTGSLQIPLGTPTWNVTATGLNQWTQSASSNYTNQSQVTGDSFQRFRLRTDGTMEWGPGNAATDTFLFRSGVATLTIDNNLVLAGTLTGATNFPAGAWSTFSPTWLGSGTNPTLGNGTLLCRYQQLGKFVAVTYQLTIGSTTTAGTGQYSFTLPVPPNTSVSTEMGSSRGTFGGTTRSGWLSINTAGNATAYYPSTGTGDNSTSANWSASTPAAPASGDVYYFTGVYEAL